MDIALNIEEQKIVFFLEEFIKEMLNESKNISN